MQIMLKIAIAICNGIYEIHKLFPVRNRIAMVSRQSSTLTLDMRLLKEELERQNPEVEIVTLNRMIPPGLVGKIKYLWYMVTREMHVFATSRVVLLEGYCINASILHHRKELSIIQLWHALGVLKQFGYYAVGTEEGHSEALAKAMHMHENYDYAICSSEFCRPYYAKAFRMPESRVKVCPLPRTDLLTDREYHRRKREEIIRRYPELGKRPNVLYAPTFRNGEDITEYLDSLFEAFNYEEYNLIVKLHPVDRTGIHRDEIFECPEFTAMELFSLTDALITDYSSIIYEAAAAEIPIYLYTFDLDRYLERRGFIIDFMKDIPLEKYREPIKLLERVYEDEKRRRAESGELRLDASQSFIEKYVQPGTGNTRRLAEWVLQNLEQSRNS